MDGPSLSTSRSQWESALSTATESFRSLISSSNDKSWRPVALTLNPTSLHSNTISGSSSSLHLNSSGQASTPASLSDPKGKAKSRPSLPANLQDPSSTSTSPSSTPFNPASDSDPTFRLSTIDPQKVAVHRRSFKGKEVIRATVEVPFHGNPDLHAFSSVLATPQTRQNWDRMVEDAEIIEVLDPQTRISKTNFRLGWPASPRDSITISRTISDDSNTLIDISTSLPRSPDAPAYLRPAPPYVRSHLHLFSWCVQVPKNNPHSSDSSTPTPFPSKEASSSSSKSSSQNKGKRLKITAFWSWDLKGTWLGMPSLPQQLPIIIKSLVDYVSSSSDSIATLSNFGNGSQIISRNFDITRDNLSIEYSVVSEDFGEKVSEDDSEASDLLKQRRRLESSLEFSLPKRHGWDIKVSVKPSLGTTSSTEWKATAERSKTKSSGSEHPNSNLTLRIQHSKIEKSDESVLAKVVIQRVEASTGLRLNDSLLSIEEVEPRNPVITSRRLLEEVANAASINSSNVSHPNSHAESSPHTGGRETSSSSTAPSPNPSHSNKASAIASLIRRNYIYFTSLLQEPEAKWKHVSDSRGVTVTQLDSIDPTLVVYRAEATFVGVNVWDLFSTITSGGARSFWDKSNEESILLNDLNDLSSLWQLKTKASWPVAARDSIVVSTSYKSPNSVHIFSFSTSDSKLFDDKIPKVESGVIRTQIDLRGWSVEALSPTTAHITLLEQSDPKGWTSKSATPNVLVNNVAGVGDYAIKFGGPPVATRLLGARATVSKYDHEKSTYRLEYSKNEDNHSSSSSSFSTSNPNSAIESGFSSNSSVHSAEDVSHIECELRCDLETWSSNLDLVVDPPPINVSCLRRHKLSSGGGGLWLTIEHDPASLEDDNARITIRKGFMPKEKGLVLVNGARIDVDFNEINEEERKELSKRKRNKPMRVPLDLTNPGRIKPKAVRAFGDGETASNDPRSPHPPFANDPNSVSASTSSAHGTFSKAEIGHGVTRPGSTAPSLGGSDRAASPAPSRNEVFSDSEKPRKAMTCALDVLFLLRRIYSERNLDPSISPAGWSLVSERNGLFVRRKLMSSISNTVSIQRSDKVVEGLNSEDFLSLISNSGCRRTWDDRIENEKVLESFGNGSKIETFTSKGGFPFRGRIFFTSSITAQAKGKDSSSSSVSSPAVSDPASSSSSSSLNHSTVYFHASSSFDEKHLNFPISRINPQNLPVGKVLIDGWILETLDPYSSTTFQIPSTRCTHVVAIDYAGSLPSGVNSMWNSGLPRAIGLVEDFVKNKGALPTVKNPKSLMKVLGDGRDEDNGFVWNLKEIRNEKSLLLLSNFQCNDKVFNLLVRIPPKEADEAREGDDDDDDDEEESRENSIQTPILTSRTLALSNASTTKGAAIQASKSSRQFNDHLKNELNVFDSTASDNLTRSSSSSAISARRSTSISSFTSEDDRNRSPLITPTASTIRSRPLPSQASQLLKKGKERAQVNVVMEAEVELKHYSNGYEIVVASEIPSSNYARNPIKKNSNEVAPPPLSGDEISSKKSSTDMSDSVSVRSVDTTTSSKTSTSTLTRGRVRGRVLPLEGAAEGRNDLPIQVSVHDLPPSAVLAATMAPNARPRKHLIRLSLPEDAFEEVIHKRQSGKEKQQQDEGSVGKESSEKKKVEIKKDVGKDEKEEKEKDDWRSPLIERGALLRLIVRPISGPMDVTPSIKRDGDDGDEADDDESGLETPVRYEGERMTVMHVNKTSAMLQRESGGVDRYATLKRLPPPSNKEFSSNAVDELLPESLQYPIAAALQLKTDLTRKHAPTSTTAAGALAAVTASAGSGGGSEKGTPNRSGTPVPADSSISTISSPLNQSEDKKPNSKDLNEKSTSNTNPSATNVSTPIMSILGSYPLSRLSGASTAVSNALANATVTSSSSSNSTSNLKDWKSTSGAEAGKGSKEESIDSNQVESLNVTTELSQTLGEIRFSLTTLILTAIISFLIGSLVRALLSPNDFVIMPSAKAISRLDSDPGSMPSPSTSGIGGNLNPTSYLDAAAHEVEKYLSGDGSSNTANTASAQVREVLSNARDMKRLVEIRRFFGWDLVVAVIRRR